MRSKRAPESTLVSKLPLPSQLLVELPEAPSFGFQLLVEMPASTRALIQGLRSNSFRQFRISSDSTNAIQYGGLDGLSGNGLRLAVLPSFLLRVVTDVVSVAFRTPHRVRVHHRRSARNAEEDPAQQSAQLVPDGGALVAAVAPKRLVDLVPGLLIDDPFVLTLVENAFVINHSGVENAGQGRVQRASSEQLPAADVSVFGCPPLRYQAAPRTFL